MEVAGIVLAVLPLVAEAFDAYSKAAQALYTFRRYHKVLTKLKASVIMHRALFVNSSEDLKSAIQGYKDTMKRIHLSHSKIEPEIEERVRMSLYACSANLDPIMASLVDITRELESFQKDRERTFLLTWDFMPNPKELVARLRLAFSGSEIDDALERLGRRVHSFGRLSIQAVELIKRINQKAQSHTRQGSAKWTCEFEEPESMEKVKQMRQASSELHSDLAKKWLCLTHNSHRVHICSAKCSNDRCFTFQTVIVGYENGETDEPIFMEIESSAQADEWTMAASTSCSQGHKDIAVDGNAMQLDSNYVFTLDARSCQSCSTREPSIHGLTQSPPTDPTRTQDLCLHFRQKCGESRSGRDFLGYLSDPGVQRIFSPGLDRRVLGRPCSLADFVSSDDVLRPISPLVSVSIAASLATSVLQFYSTPWLPTSWSSKDVTFFRLEASVEDTFDPPHFSIQLEQKVDRGKGVEHGGKTFGGSSPRNALLFQLGVVLLETGLARPWARMREAVIESNRVGEGATDYDIADHLAQTDLRRCIGQEFSIIVRKCLGCDFGLGESNFGDEKLQAVFHRDVVHSLHALDGRMDELRQGPT